MQRSVESQALAALHQGPIVLHSQSIANPHKARASRCLCLFHAAGFLLLRLSAPPAPPPPFYSLGVCSSVGDFGSQIRLCQASAFIFFLFSSSIGTPPPLLPQSSEAAFGLSTHPTPPVKRRSAAEVATLEPWFDRTKAGSGDSGQLVLLSGTAACHAFNSLSRCLFPL